MPQDNSRPSDGLTYKDAGVDIDAGEALVERIGPAAKATRRRGADADLGGFGGLFDLKAAGFKDPILVAGTDGVGTKLKLAIDTGRFDGIGQDLVAMCVNDIVVQGAEPLFFLDYYATGKLEVDSAAAVPKTERMKEGDVLIGVASSGVHSNGYSLVRKVVEKSGLTLESPAPFAPGKSLGDALLTPTRLYVRAALAAMHAGGVKGLAHITGGGITDNLPRCLPQTLDAEVDLGLVTVLPVFQWLAKQAGIAEREMLRTFNCGIGLVAVTDEKHAGHVIDAFQEAGDRAARIGKLIAGSSDGASAASRDGAGEPRVVYRGALKL